MKKIMALILITGSLFAQERVLSLKESLLIGLQNSKELKISKSKIELSKEKLSEIRSQFLPQFKLQANYTRISDNIPPFEVSLPFSQQPVRISNQLLDNYSFKLGFAQPLFTGFRLSSLKNSAASNLKSSELNYSNEESETAFNIYTLYWNFYKAAEIKEVIKLTLQQMENHLEDTRNFYENGLVTTNDLLKLEVEYSNTKLKLIEAENNYQLARIAFNKAIGIEMDASTRVLGNEMVAVSGSYSLQEIIKETMNNRKEIKSLSHKIEASKEGISAAKSSWLPSLYLTGNYYYSNPNPRFQPAKDEFNNNWELGITLSWDIWNWGQTSSQVSQAEQLKFQLETTLDQLKENVQMEVYSNYLNLKKSEEKLKVSKEALSQALENYRVVSEKYNIQLVTSTELIDAEASKLLAETNVKTAEVDYQIAKVKLEKSIGRRTYQ